jgi:TonB family protein
VSPVGRAISWREGVLISILVHLVLLAALALSPQWLPAGQNIRPAEPLLVDRLPEEETRFVFVQPRVDPPAPRPPLRADQSDRDRLARAPERPPDPANAEPFSRGNSPERVEAIEEAEAAAGEVGPEPPAPQAQAAVLPPELPADLGSVSIAKPRIGGGALGDALRNLQRYVEAEQFNNPRGGSGTFGPAIQFDTKGVEFGPWVRRFVAQVKRNWEPLIPLAAWSMHGHVVITFNVHKNGLITDLEIVKPASLDAFNNAAYGALASSSPTAPLPAEYPSPRAFFTVTFFYNEAPK